MYKIYLFIHVHEQKGGNLAHALTVANFSIIHRVSRQNMKKGLLPTKKHVSSIAKNVMFNWLMRLVFMSGCTLRIGFIYLEL